MKKRNVFTLMLVVLLAFSLGMGTLAYYTKTFSSNDNVVRAAKFTVDSNGTLDENLEFDLTGDPLYPGIQKDLYEFEIDKKDTEVPVKYGVTVTGRQRLFDGNSPVKLNLYKKTGNDWNLYDGASFIAREDVEYFKIEAVWNHSDNDLAYQNATGKVAINLVATQADEETTPEGPKINLEYSFDGTHFRLILNSENLETSIPKSYYYRLRILKDNGDIDYQSLWRIIGDENIGILPSNMKIDENTKFILDIADHSKNVLRTFLDVSPVKAK